MVNGTLDPTEASNLGWQQVWRMVGAMPADAQPVVTSAFADTPVDIRRRVRETVATRTIADTLHDQRLAASVSRVQGLDQAGLAELASEGSSLSKMWSTTYPTVVPLWSAWTPTGIAGLQR